MTRYLIEHIYDVVYPDVYVPALWSRGTSLSERPCVVQSKTYADELCVWANVGCRGHRVVETDESNEQILARYHALLEDLMTRSLRKPTPTAQRFRQRLASDRNR